MFKIRFKTTPSPLELFEDGKAVTVCKEEIEVEELTEQMKRLLILDQITCEEVVQKRRKS